MKEFNPFFKKFSKNFERIAVVYPNRYVGGITNLGLQRIYFEVNSSEDYIAERFYTDVFDGLRSVESGTPLKDFSVAMFSLQYEEDVFNALKILKKSGFAGKTIAGGPCVIQNPFPFINLFDRLFVGEVENAVLETIQDGDVKGLIPKSFVRRTAELDSEMKSQIVSENAFGKSILVEIGRGCPRGCRFCIVRQIYSPARWRNAEDIISVAEENRGIAEKIAIIAPSPTDHPDFIDVVHELRDMGFAVSPSSIRADRFDEEMADLLGNIRTLTLAPETGSEKLREMINKGMSNDDVMGAVEIAENVEKIKLYFMFGFPGEKKEDLDEIVKLVESIRKLGKRVEVSVNPLVPKPHTPFQWLPYGGRPDRSVVENMAELRQKRRYLLSRLRRISKVEVESVEKFAVQTVISRGDGRVGDFIGKKLTLSKIIKFGLSEFLEFQPLDREFPWDRMGMGYRKDRLRREFERAMEIAEVELP